MGDAIDQIRYLTTFHDIVSICQDPLQASIYIVLEGHS